MYSYLFLSIKLRHNHSLPPPAPLPPSRLLVLPRSLPIILDGIFLPVFEINAIGTDVDVWISLDRLV